MTSEYANDLKVLVLDKDLVTSNTFPNEQLGVVQGEYCSTRVLGFGGFAQPYKAIDDIKERHKIKMLKRARLTHIWDQYGFWDKDCWSIVGIGYR